ncbi:MAG: hypothetical protein JXC32_12265, partial [Anaerolineae bacterium]|nr:hypothetical protein [Anaerolineae bacterium]
MDDSLRHRLRRLGVAKGLAGLVQRGKPETQQHKPASETPAVELPGEATTLGSGTFWLSLRRFSPEATHGRYALGGLADVGDSTLGLLGVPDLGPRPA